MLDNRLYCVLTFLLALSPCVGWGQPPTQTQEQPSVQADQDEDGIPKFDGEEAYQRLVEICDIGPRISTTDGMAKQQAMIQEYMEALGGTVEYQPFNATNPISGRLVELKNLVVRWHPEREKRLLLCCHYDTRPFPDRDPVNPRGVFLGANDGASGVALLMELAKTMPNLEGPWGIDMVFFDGEEFVFDSRRDPMFLGSTFFANEYAAGRWEEAYVYGILVDMIGDKNLQIFYEKNTMKDPDALRLMRSIWAVAKEMGREEFQATKRHKIRDDHLPLIQIAKIPTVDIIDFDYPDKAAGNQYWHTTQDVPENCSAESLHAVGSVLQEWLIQLEQIR